MKKLKYVKTFESFSNSEFDKIAEDVNKYLSDTRFISMVNRLPKFIKNKMVNFVDKNGFDIDLIEETIEKYNLVQKVKSIYDKGVRDISGFIDSLLGKKMATVNEEIGLFGGTVIVAIIILVIGALSGSESILGFGMVVGIPVGIASLIAVLLGGDNMSNRSSDKEEFAKPGTEFKIGDQEYVMNAPLDTLSSRQKYNLGENKVLEDTIKYKGETNNFIVLDNGDGTYTLLKKGDSGTYKAVETK